MQAHNEAMETFPAQVCPYLEEVVEEKEQKCLAWRQFSKKKVESQTWVQASPKNKNGGLNPSSIHFDYEPLQRGSILCLSPKRVQNCNANKPSL